MQSFLPTLIEPLLCVPGDQTAPDHEQPTARTDEPADRTQPTIISSWSITRLTEVETITENGQPVFRV